MEINNNKKIKQNDQSKYNYSTDENNDNKKMENLMKKI